MQTISQAFHAYLDAYFLQRDWQAAEALTHPDIKGFGTALDERIFSPDSARKVALRDISQAPNPVTYEMTRMLIDQPSQELGVVTCELNISTEILDQQLKLNNIRGSCLLVKNNNQWLIYHLHFSLPASEHGEDESYPIKELEEHNQVLKRRVAEKTRELQVALEEIKLLANTDRLTGLHNRLRIDGTLKQLLQQQHASSQPLAVILMDLDYFKETNDQHGHLSGDQILQEVAQLLQDSTRKTDLVGRWGGEEFLIICPQTSQEEAQQLAEKLRNQLASHFFTLPISQTASFGVASHQTGDTQDNLILRADQALYRAKEKGRNCVCCEDS
ncbi:diguanylate cyclase domain-containing protein [Marinospirillum sp.]|uniref:diguanylate cyclase domain-containing protein n=1 Tax=Marinospirillum sp. TaxID=2183934 RepID=UPI00287090B2|nr:diguanylate cyclase [Marinospirillum sp.]MDR9467092.1 diguanylate cyclase [Marinospirillum sp.]